MQTPQTHRVMVRDIGAAHCILQSKPEGNYVFL